jgi:asparagine synthase (glutamine-hydrolysing)
MCGIFSYIGNSYSKEELLDNFNRIVNRGPDSSKIISVNDVILGFHRLAINDLSEDGMQPFIDNNDIYLICNGEIYNHKKLYKDHLSEFKLKSNSDCEVIIYLYKLFGIEETCRMLDGVFSFVLYDKLKNKVYVARDPYGVRPLFIGYTHNSEMFICSELKGIYDKCIYIKQFNPGSYLEYKDKDNYELNKYHNNNFIINKFQPEDFILTCIRSKLIGAVKKRLLSDRPIGALLSGGLDSSLVSGIICKLYKDKCIKNKLQTFSIGLTGATDLEYAKSVSDYIGSEHHTIECTEDSFLKAISDVIYNIESYDTTTVRASVGNYLVAEYIKQNTDIVVLFNGDGSDEQSGYKYLRNAPNSDSFNNECNKLLNNIQYFDVLRSDRSVSSKWSLEARTPFLDKEFVQYYMTIDPKLKMYNNENGLIEKYLLRKAFSGYNIIPDEVLWRPKEAFSDGCSSEERSWHKIIQEHVDNLISDDEFNLNKNKYKINPPLLKESYFYRKIFDSYYPGKANIIPYFWLPNWSDEIDPSARELS